MDPAEIIIKENDGYKGIETLHNGQPPFTGEILLHHYWHNEENVKKLINSGTINQLGLSLKSNPKHDSSNINYTVPSNESTVTTWKDTKDLYNDIANMKLEAIFYYLFKNGKWYYIYLDNSKHVKVATDKYAVDYTKKRL